MTSFPNYPTQSPLQHESVRPLSSKKLCQPQWTHSSYIQRHFPSPHRSESGALGSDDVTQQSDSYYRIDPPLGLGNTDLVDCFHVDQVEKAISEWLDTPEHTQYICDIASQLVNRDTEPVTVEQARTREPPPPPPETNPGYNPQLDKKRPETMMDYLRKYHVLFVIDDSGSMTQDNRWGEARDALVGVAEHAVKYGSTEIDMRFFNSSKKCQDVKSVDIVVNIFNQTTPKGAMVLRSSSRAQIDCIISGVTPTGAVLKEILDDHILKLDAAVNQSEYYDIKPLDVIVITDGIPTDKPKDVLVEEALRIRSRKHHPNCVGIQFVQIGSDDNAEAALKDLMFGNIGNMVDTVPYTAVLTPQRLERILLGGIQPNVRALLPIV
ncbi:hypothetical protein PILCRDRAFT_665625 [Piloderma croceum F 1598]|uniref:VWFA domain-containing protein n=1 Tax=Piloderma croceum (strain F 1598) TaxID=765440 RepID=A0A0C3API6_PILCF|nr:hypothetical protein PILCRDRAFT_665625 [Piloderma croceum F 1598]